MVFDLTIKSKIFANPKSVVITSGRPKPWAIPQIGIVPRSPRTPPRTRSQRARARQPERLRNGTAGGHIRRPTRGRRRRPQDPQPWYGRGGCRSGGAVRRGRQAQGARGHDVLNLRRQWQQRPALRTRPPPRAQNRRSGCAVGSEGRRSARGRRGRMAKGVANSAATPSIHRAAAKSAWRAHLSGRKETDEPDTPLLVDGMPEHMRRRRARATDGALSSPRTRSAPHRGIATGRAGAFGDAAALAGGGNGDGCSPSPCPLCFCLAPGPQGARPRRDVPRSAGPKAAPRRATAGAGGTPCGACACGSAERSCRNAGRACRCGGAWACGLDELQGGAFPGQPGLRLRGGGCAVRRRRPRPLPPGPASPPATGGDRASPDCASASREPRP